MIHEKYTAIRNAIKYPNDLAGRTLEYRRTSMDAYRKACKECDEAFELALYDEYGVSNNPKREKAFRIAWQEGHSSGYSEVETYFEEMAELIK